MIAPRSQLLFWAAAIVLPFSLLGAVEPAVARPAFVCIGAAALAAVVDAIGARRSLAGIGLSLAAIIRMTKDRDAKIEIRIRNERRRAAPLRIALDLPGEISSPSDEIETLLPKDSEWSAVEWPCLPVKRGGYKLETVYIEGRSSLGLWAVRKSIPARSEIRVYPNLIQDRNELAALFLNRGALGLHAQRQVGKGREFEKLREYLPGDSFDEIHWKASARRGRPVTKVFRVERAQEIYVVIDASRLSARETVSQGALPRSARSTNSDLERFVTAALVLGLAAEKQGDLFGLLAFTDRVEAFVRAQSGKGHYAACRDALYTLQPKSATPDFEDVCSFIRLRIRRRALLIFLTSLDDPALAESFIRDVELIRRHHVVLVNMLTPSGAGPLFSTPDADSADDLYKRLGGHFVWRDLQEIEAILHSRGVQFSRLSNERLSAELVSQYVGVKQRQLL